MSATEIPAADAGKGWDAFNAAIATARTELAAAAPDANTAVEAEAYLARIATQGLNDALLGHLLVERGLNRALPTRGGPNPDYIIYGAGIDPTRQYRLSGRLNDSERIGIGLYSVSPAGVVMLSSYAAFDKTSAQHDGQFSLAMATGATGPGTLAIAADARVLVIRILHRRPQAQPALVALDGGTAGRDLALAGGSTERALTQAGQSALRSVRQFLRWSRLISASPNRFTPPPPVIAQEAQGDPDTTYFFGYYDLGPNQSLEVWIPAGTNGYWSLHAYNHWCEYLPNASVHDLNAVVDTDGRIRAHIGPALAPSLANKVNTLGRHRGVLIFRAIGAGDLQVPQTTVRRG